MMANVIESFNRQVELTPNRIAIYFKERSLTYKELDSISDELSNFIISECGVKNGDIVPVLVDRSENVIVAILAILKSGAAYVILSDKYPKDRIDYIKKVVKSNFVLDNKIFEIFRLSKEKNSQKVVDNIQLSDCAYLVFTSGTTGRPKGVVHTHKSVLSHIENFSKYFNFDSSEHLNVLLIVNFIFSVSTTQIFGALLNGHTLFITDNNLLDNSTLLTEYINENQINYFQATPAILESLNLSKIHSLDMVALAGEKISQQLYRKAEKSKIKLINVYGQSEFHAATAKIISSVNDVNSIGKSIPGVKVYVLDDEMCEVDTGEQGEIYVVSEQLAEGYLANDLEDSSHFVKNPFGEGRICRTGDLGVRLQNDEIKFVGRKDFQLNINGIRIEPGEIEKAIVDILKLEKVVTIEKDSKIVAYYVSPNEIDENFLRTELLTKLPPYMVPNYFIRLDEFPLNPNGKLDRSKLPNVVNSVSELSLDIGKLSESEAILVDQLNKVLGIRINSLEDSFIALGGNSLQAIKLANALYQLTSKNISSREILTASSIKMLSLRIENGPYKNGDVTTYTTNTMSPTEKRMYILHSKNPNSVLYNEQTILKFNTKIDCLKLRKAVELLANKYEILRTSFSFKNGIYQRDVLNKANFEFIEEAYNSNFEKNIRPFDLEKGLTMRIFVLHDLQSDYLLIDKHHIITDGVSEQLFYDDLSNFYLSDKELIEDTVSLCDAVTHVDKLQESKSWWLNHLKGYERLNLIKDLECYPNTLHKGDTFISEITPNLSNKVENFSKANNVSEYTIYFTIFSILLSKMYNSSDFVIGTVSSGRNFNNQNSIGMFVNTLPIRVKPKGNTKLDDYINEVNNILLTAIENEDYQFDQIVSDFHESEQSENPFFDCMFVYQNYSHQTYFDGKAKKINYKSSNAKFKLTFEIEVLSNKKVLYINFDSSYFSKDTIKNLESIFYQILRVVNSETTYNLGQIPLVEVKKYEKAPANEFRDVVSEFEKQVVVYPEKIALRFNDICLTYVELNRKVNTVANYMINYLKISKGDIVPLLLDRSDKMVIAILAVLKIGAAYVPISKKYPRERIDYIIEACTSDILIDDEFMTQDFGDYSNQNPNIEISSHDLAYVIFTSGTTGNPKGVMVEHVNLSNYCFEVVNTENSGMNPDNINAAFFEYVFDASLHDLVRPFVHGESCVIFNTDLIYDIDKFIFELKKYNINTIGMTPSLAGKLDLTKVPTMKTIFCGGEAITQEVIEKYRETQIKLKNCYGPTETTIMSFVNNDVQDTSIGKPIKGVYAYILDDSLNPLPKGAIGNLYIGGNQVSRGYINQPEETKRRFISNPFDGGVMYETGDLLRERMDGSYEYLGRKDFQVKIRGFRIELGEVEKAIISENIVKQVAVVSFKNNLVAYYVSDKSVSDEIFEERLSLRLPSYMIPHYFVKLDSLPITINGKLDKSRLPEPYLNNEYIEPITLAEKEVAKAFCDVLKLDRVSVNDSFFKLGGNSIVAIELANYINVPVKTIFEKKTVRNISASLSEKSSLSLTKNSNDAEVLSFEQEQLLYIDSLENGTSVYNIPLIINLNEKVDIFKLEDAIKKVLDRHKVLRTIVGATSGTVIKSVNISHQKISYDEFFNYTFNLKKEIPIRVNIFENTLLINVHHIAFDGWSTNILIDEIQKIYKYQSLPELSYQYNDFANWQHNNDTNYLKTQEEYWISKLQGYENLDFPIDKPRPSQFDYIGKDLNLDLDEKLYTKLVQLAKNNDTSLYVVTLSAFLLTLSAYANQKDIVLGTPVANRNIKGTEDLIGYFVNTLVLRTEIDNELSVKEFIEKNKTLVIDAQENQNYPFEHLVSNLKVEQDLSRNPIFQIMFGFQDMSPLILDTDIFESIENGYSLENTKFDLSVMFSKNRVTFTYAESLFFDNTIAQFADTYQFVLEQFIYDGQLLKNIKFSVDDVHVEEISYPKIPIHKLFEEEVSKHPDEIALVYGNEVLTYSELNKKVNRLANTLIKKYKIQSGSYIPILMDRSEQYVIAILAILKIGACYIPLSKDYPQERIDYIIETTGASFILDESVEIMLEDDLNPDIDVSLNDLAYIIFTSGTTGKPKGVMIEHKGVINTIYNQINYFDIKQSTKIIHFAEFVFDASVYELFIGLLSGSTLYLLENEVRLDYKLLKQFVINKNIELATLPPAILNERDLLPLKTLIVAGENTPEKIYKAYYKQGTEIVNAYGPTEITVCATVKKYELGMNSKNIGSPQKNVYCLVLNSSHEILPENAIGELYIGGKGLARGYFNDPEKTELAFINHPLYGRLYKTGDLVKRLHNGELIYIGRNDFQVKLRGFRIELGEIETQLMRQPLINRCLVQVKNNSLVAYYTGTLSYKLDGYLPAYMVPNYYVQLTEFPLTINGKIDLRKLPEPTIENKKFEAPTTKREKEISEAVCELLNFDKVSINDNFYEIGGNSILALKLSSKINLSVKQIIESKTIKQMSIVDKVNTSKLIKSISQRESYYTSISQEQLWIINKFSNNTAAYNVPIVLELLDNVDANLLVKSIQKIVEKHEVLRTIIKDNRQFVTDEKLSISNYPIDLNAFVNESFDLSKEIPIKVNLYDKILAINIHHIAFDGWSTEKFLGELIDNYYNKEESALNIQYKDYAYWQREFLNSNIFKEQESFWLHQLYDYEPLNLPVDYSRPKEYTYSGSNIEVTFKSEWKDGLEQVAKKHKTTLYVVMLTILDIVLAQFSYQDDIIVGSPFANRHISGTENLIGFFVNSLPVRTKVSQDSTFNELLKKNHEQILEIQKNQDIPFEKIVQSLNNTHDLSRNPIYQVFFSVQDFTSEVLKDNNIFKILNTASINNFAKYDLSVMVENGLVVFNYCNDIYSHSTIESIKQSYIELIKAVINLGNFTVSDSPIAENIIEGEIKKYPKLSVVDLFYKQVDKTPENIAIEYKNVQLTYKEFDHRTNSFANYLLTHGVSPGDNVAILLPRSEKMAIAIWGILKAGCAYVPITSEYPKERIEYILHESKSKYLIQENFEGFMFDDITKISLDINLNDLAYIIFTSGTTGKPKGVMIEHAGLSNRIQWMNDKYPLNEKDIIYQKTNYVFDVSVWEQIWALIVGAKIVFAKDGGHKDPLYLAREITEKQITTMHFVPSMLDVFLDTIELYSENGQINLSCLKYVFCSGEALSLSSVKRFKQLLPSTQLHNLYGPTEASIDVTYFDCNYLDIDKVLIGKPVANTNCCVISKSNKILPKGAIGELAISGIQLARGYINQPKLTNSSFIDIEGCGRVYKTGDLARILDDNNIEYLGRNDFQVKINGLRIELAEVEKQILGLSKIQQTVVLKSDSQLVAYYVADQELKEDEIKEQLRDRLPSYMVPSIFIFMTHLPLTINGKLDRRALPSPKIKASNTIVENEIELQLQNIVATLLGRSTSEIDILASFFNLGGDSIKAIQLSNKIKQVFDVSIPVNEVFDAKNIKNLAKKVIKKDKSDVISEQGFLTGEVNLLPIQEWFFNNNFSECFNQGFGIKLPKDVNLEKLKHSLKDLINYHDSLRIYFKNDKQYYGNKIENVEIEIIDDDSILSKLENKFELSQKLYKFIYISSQNILGVICHHLIIDTVSWEIISSDLKALYNGQQLPPKGTSYRQWGEALLSIKNTFNNNYPSQFQEYEVQENMQSSHFHLSTESTNTLLNDINRVYNTSTINILLTSLARALNRIWPSEETYVQLESHGRANIDESINIQRTVGWFTSIYPQKISVDLVKTKLYGKENLDLGVGYGLLNGIRAEKLPKILFNYLGQISVTDSEWSIVKADLGCMSDIEPNENLVINSGIYQKQLFVELSGKINSLDLISQYLREEIINLVNGLNETSRTYLTSDDINYLISQDSLDKIQDSEEVVDILPASSLQQGFVYQALNNYQNDNAYICAYAFEYNNSVDINIYKHSWELAQERYPSLRLCLDIVDGEVVQIIPKKATLDFEYIETDEVDELINDERNKLFTLSVGALFRVRLIKTSKNKYICVLINHHAILDGWSNSILMNCVHNFYYGLLTDSEISFEVDNAYLEGQRFIHNNLAYAKKYWDENLNEVNHPDISGLFRHDKHQTKIEEIDYIQKPVDKVFTLENSLYNSLKQFSKENELTINIILQYAWHKLLSVYGGITETTIGVVNSGRQFPINGIEDSVGLYIQTVPIQFQHSNSGLKSELNSLQTINQNALINGGVSLAELQINRTRLFDTVFIYENYPIESNDLPESDGKLEIVSVKAVEKLDYPITIVIFEKNENLFLQFKYDDELFEEKTIEKLFNFMKSIVKQIVNNVSYLTYVEYVPRFSTGRYSQSNIVEKFELEVLMNPDRVALRCNDIELTYSQLNGLSNIFARNLMTKFSVQEGDRVPLLLEKSEKMVIAILGILKAGAAYVPMSPKFPAERIKYITELVESKVVIDEKVINLLLTERNNTNNLNLLIKPNALAYIIFTSGTTGKPKGVMVEHRNFLNYLDNMLSAIRSNGTEDIEFGCIAEYVFDIFGTEIFGQLLRGKTVSLFTGLPEDFPQYMKNNRITTLQSTPGKISYLFQNNDSDILNTDLTTILVGGEKMNDAFANRFKDLTLINIYGPTEGTVWTSMKKVDSNYINYSNIGKPFNNYVHYVLDEQMRLLPDGAIGELYIGGPQLSRGYYGKSELTSKVFRKNPYNLNNIEEYSLIYKTGDIVRRLSNGEFELIGRNDFQVKIRGFRIELGEIEAAMLKIPEINQVLALSLGEEDSKYLGVYYTGSKELTKEYIENIISKYLTDYMIPSGYQYIDEFPLTINGKIDRRALPIIDYSSSVEYIAPRTSGEKIVRDCIASILNIDNSKLSILENFFNIGGDSIKAIKLISSLNKKLHKSLDIKVIFENKTIEKISNSFSISDAPLDTLKTLKVSKQEFGKVENQVLSFAQEQYISTPKTSYSNVKIAFRIKDTTDVEKLIYALEKVVERHEILRTKLHGNYQYISNEPFVVTQNAINREKYFSHIFDLEKECPIKANIYDNIFTCLIDHIAFDGWSTSLFLRDIEKYYYGEAVDELKFQYKDYAKCQQDFLNSPKVESQLKFWKDELSSYEPTKYFSTKKLVIDSKDGADEYLHLEDGLYKEINKYVKKYGTTIHNFLLSIFFLSVSKASNQKNISIMIPSLNRNVSGVEDLIGLFINKFLVTINLNKDISYDKFLNDLNAKIIDYQNNQDIPFEMIANKLDLDLSGCKLYFGIQGFKGEALKNSTIFEALPEMNSKAQKDAFSDLTIFVWGQNIDFNYAKTTFNREEILNFINIYETILYKVLKNNSIKINTIIE
ncbi:amino acid adenylation domain-containing protein [Streptococcus jiangjianxini]|uniref:amino acid adenylation domain-containing protein n=1 Tax=Streptococcus jiangjianxini TaxID=3161189 RepID=UPI0032EC0399